MKKYHIFYVIRKREISKRILDALCKVLPSYVRPNQDEYEYNVPKIETALKKKTHPLLLRQLVVASQKVELGPSPQQTTIEPRSKPLVSSTDDDEVHVLSIENIDDTGNNTARDNEASTGQIDGEPETTIDSFLGEELEHGELVTPVEGALDLAEGLSADETLDEEDVDGGWSPAQELTFNIDKSVLFDDGKVGTELEKGLSFINPIEREKEIDRQFSSASGYRDPYQGMGNEARGFSPEKAIGGPLKRLPASPFVGTRCAMDDGDISEEDGHVYQCPNCQVCFHAGCARLIVDFQHGICPVCGAMLEKTLQ